jgi:hypothetical protein
VISLVESHGSTLAGDLTLLERTVVQCGPPEAPVPVEVLTPRKGAVPRILDRLQVARAAYLARMPLAEIVGRLDEVARRWRDPNDQYRRAAEELLPATTGLSRPMVALLLDRMFGQFTSDRLWALLDNELPDRTVLDRFVPDPDGRRWVRAHGPVLVTHVFGGGDPTLPAVPLVLTMLCKAAAIGKLASSEPVFAVLLVRSIAAVDRCLAKCMLTVWWAGGAEGIETDVLRASECVVAFGSDAAVGAIAGRLRRETRLVAYGHRIGVAIVGREALAAHRIDDLAGGLALDASAADQLTCLSPQLVFVEEGGALTPRELARAVAAQFATVEARFPRGRPSRAIAVALRRFRDTYEFRAGQSDSEIEVVTGSGVSPPWIVVYDARGRSLEPTPGYRTIRVCAVADAGDVVALIRAGAPLVSTVGHAVGPDRLTDLAAGLGEAGVSRVCPIGQMTSPPLATHHDGMPRLGSFLRWTDLEGAC